MAARKAKRRMLTEGFDGAEIHFRTRPIPGTRIVQVQAIRSHRGTFEWRYGAKVGGEDGALYEAGCSLARIWEKAGLDGPGTVDWSRVSCATYRGYPPPRLVALDILKDIRGRITGPVVDRLAFYVAQGRTAGDIARLYGRSERKMREILRDDLRAAAEYFGHMTRETKR